MLFQRLPFFLRRRTQSYKPKKRKTRKKSFLTTYIGKRFFVTDTLPIKRRLKSSKFVYKSKKVFLFYEFKVKDYFIFECFNKERSIFDEIIWFSDIKSGSDLCTDEQILESKEILTVDQIFKNKQILLDDWLKEKTNNFTLTSFYFKNKFVCHKSQLNKILFKKEFCLISINEMFRIILEKKIFLKYLNVFDKNYHNFEKLAKKEEMMKNERRPLSKKQRLEYFEMMDYKYCCFFEVKKGSVVMNDKVFSEDEVIGNVLFVEYCYSVGRKRGVCWLTKLCSNLVVKNLVGKIVEIEIVESIKKDEFYN